MITIFAILHLFKTVWDELRDPNSPEFRGLLSLVLFVLLMGMFFYHRVEGWSLLDSLYFSVITLTTIGYGDLTPHTTLGKIFTIFYVFLGLGILVGFVNVIAGRVIKRQGFFTEHL